LIAGDIVAGRGEFIILAMAGNVSLVKEDYEHEMTRVTWPRSRLCLVEMNWRDSEAKEIKLFLRPSEIVPCVGPFRERINSNMRLK
jgi:hypothetical protein